MSNINIARFCGNKNWDTVFGLDQWDYGQILRIQGLDLPDAVEIHFSLQEAGGEAKRRIGTRDGDVTDVVIPDFILEGDGATEDYKAYAFIYLSSEEFGKTTHKIIMQIKARPEPEGHTKSDETTFGAIMDAVNKIAEQSGQGVSDEKIQEAVNAYMEANPVEGNVTVDTDLSETSTNPVQNKVVTAKFSQLSDTVNDQWKDIANKELSGTAEAKVAEHNISNESHSDIRSLIDNLSKLVTSLLDSDDETLNQTSEIVAYVKSNKSLIDSITTSKVNVSDIIDNLTTNVSNKPLSAKQGVVLKGLIDTLQAELNKITIPTTLPNPNALTIKCGDSEVVYDGTQKIELEIEEKMGGDNIDVDAELKEYMNAVKPKIKQAIINKGGNVQETDSFGDYATRIDEIPNGVYAAENLPAQAVLTATYTATNPSGITLNFTDVGADGYLIVKKTGAKPETSADGTIVYNGTHTVDILDEDVVIGNVYYYRIYPRNSKNQYQSLEEQSVAVCNYKSREAQKQAKDLVIDESVAMGYYNNQVFIWKVVDTQDNAGPMMAAEQNCGNKQWDCPENNTDNPNPITARKNSGNNRWCYSNIRQWLNSDAEAGAWYLAQHEYDVAPSYKTEAGFLNGFTEIEKEAIVVRTNACILDSNDGGGTETVQDAIWFPSSYELGKEVTCEGYDFEKYDGTNASTTYTSNFWTRTINNALTSAETACSVRIVSSGGALNNNYANNSSYAARPFCQLREDTWLAWSDALESYILADDSQRTWEV